MKFADPKNDIAFKEIFTGNFSSNDETASASFGNENKTEVLISFLNSILDSVLNIPVYQKPSIKSILNISN